MLRLLLTGLALLHLGPGLAFALMAFGCDDAAPLLGGLCAGSTVSQFMRLTLALWALLGLLAWAHARWRQRRPKGRDDSSDDTA